MDNQIKAALRGDKQAQADCTAAGVLIPCGHCGGRAVMVKGRERGHAGMYSATCGECFVSTPWDVTESTAINRWNTRASTVVHGRWGEYEAFPITPSLNGNPCSNCKTHFSPSEIAVMNYCPNCGAKMDGGLEDGNERML